MVNVFSCFVNLFRLVKENIVQNLTFVASEKYDLLGIRNFQKFCLKSFREKWYLNLVAKPWNAFLKQKFVIASEENVAMPSLS